MPERPLSTITIKQRSPIPKKPLTPSSTPLPLGRPESSEAPTAAYYLYLREGFCNWTAERGEGTEKLSHPTGRAIFLILWRLLITNYLRHSSEHSLTSTSGLVYISGLSPSGIYKNSCTVILANEQLNQ
eukprot:scaffold4075_cov116-Skeletonema_dohrnii-CCMP3373.AAC.1